jgi:hypothetical protein
MSIIGWIHADDTDMPTGPRLGSWDGKHVPYGVIGGIVDECGVVCAACLEEYHCPGCADIMTGSGEADYPGLTCANWTDCAAETDGTGDVILPETLLVSRQHLDELTDRELVALDLDRDIGPETAHYFLRERDRIADERDHMERRATLKGHESYDAPEVDHASE